MLKRVAKIQAKGNCREIRCKYLIIGIKRSNWHQLSLTAAVQLKIRLVECGPCVVWNALPDPLKYHEQPDDIASHIIQVLNLKQHCEKLKPCPVVTLLLKRTA